MHEPDMEVQETPERAHSRVETYAGKTPEREREHRIELARANIHRQTDSPSGMAKKHGEQCESKFRLHGCTRRARKCLQTAEKAQWESPHMLFQKETK